MTIENSIMLSQKLKQFDNLLTVAEKIRDTVATWA